MKKIRQKYCTRKRALALVTVLWVVMILTIVVAVTAKTSRLDTRLTMSGSEQVMAKWANRAALEIALAQLSMDLSEDLPASDGILDFWMVYPEYSEVVEMPGCVFNIQFEDETSKLNINSITKEQLIWLPYMTENIADAIIDWRDTNQTPESLGTEGTFYLNLPIPYLIRDGEFRTLRELLLVNEMTPQLFYGEDANGNGQLDYNENDGDITPPYDNGDGILDLGLVSYLTCFGAGRVNVNTAPVYVLRSLLQGDIALAENIVAYRQSTTEGILSVDELQEIMPSEVYQAFSGLVTVSSNIWTIHGTTTAIRTGAMFKSEMVVDRSQDPVQVLSWYQGAKN
ncbi:MAG: general secretion pathway protein GspK [Planctomycetes bacterium]|nr:general secretion pathway protein GspK [Planctomycetota bacterium]